MKINPSLRWLLTAAGLGVLASNAHAQVSQLEVDVRSEIKDKPFGQPLPQGKGNHAKVYGILSVQLIPAEGKMIKPVDAYKLQDLVRGELAKRGFQEVPKGAKPAILLTVQYGRSWMRNPYFGTAQSVSENAPLVGGAGDQINAAKPVQTQSIDMGDAHTLMRLQENGVEPKAQKAQYEKLCIKITAWDYPTAQKAKAKQLWNTIMVVDDPDHLDLNEIAEKMLEAGSPYFDQEIKDEEVAVFKPLPDGHVHIGNPAVVQSDPKK